MKTLSRTPSGTLKVAEASMPAMPTIEAVGATVEEPSPIVTTANTPVAPKIKAVLPASAHEFKKENLLAKMKEAPQGTIFTTNQFAPLIAPHFKKSVDPVKHDIWDFSLSYVRHLMRQLVKDGLVKEEKVAGTNRVTYQYTLIEVKT